MVVEFGEGAKSGFSSLFYITILVVIIIIGLVIFFIKRLNYGFKQVLKSIGFSLLVTLIFEILFFVIGLPIGLFSVWCKMGGKCPTAFEVYLEYVPSTAITVFLVSLFVYYVVKIVKRR